MPSSIRIEKKKKKEKEGTKYKKFFQKQTSYGNH